MFLIYISVHNLNSRLKLFADDPVLYSEISNVRDVNLFQQDLDTLSCWAATWQMNFNFVKCNIMSITRSPLKFPAGYKLCNSPLESRSCHKYLGVFIQDNLEWDSRVKSVKHKAMKILGLLRRNFWGSSQYAKTQSMQLKQVDSFLPTLDKNGKGKNKPLKEFITIDSPLPSQHIKPARQNTISILLIY